MKRSVVKILLLGLLLYFSGKGMAKAQDKRIYHVQVKRQINGLCGNGEKYTPGDQNYWGTYPKDGSFSITATSHVCNKTFTFTGAGSQDKYCIENVSDCKTEARFYATATTYTIPDLKGDNVNPYECVTSETSKEYSFSVDRSGKLFTEKRIGSVYLQIATSSSFSNASEVKLSLTQDKNTFSYKELTGSNSENWYGKSLFFRLKMVIKSGSSATAYGQVSKPVTFFRSIPEPELISVDRSSCIADEQVTIRVAPEIAKNISNYRFRGRAADKDEQNANIISLKYLSHEGNDITLFEDEENSKAGFSENKKTYIFQVFNAYYDKFEKISDYQCVTPFEPEIIAKPKLPNHSLTPEVIGKDAMKEYHITRYDKTDGEIKINISNLINCDGPLFVEYQRNEGPVQRVAFNTLPSGGGNTRVLSGLGEGEYKIKIEDEDGCPSAVKTEKLNKPKNVVLETLNNTQKVTCHPENGVTEESAGKDGQLSVSWSGGIPPYTVTCEGVGSKSMSTYSTDFSNLEAGDYNVKISDKYNVLVAQSKEVLSNPKVGFNFTNRPVKCYGDNTDITINIENGQTGNSFQLYNLNGDLLHPGSTGISPDTYVFYGQPAQQYRVDVASGKCMASDTIEITGPDDINFQATGSKIAAHGGADGKIELDISGGTGQFTYKVYDVLGTKVDSNVTRQLATISNLSHGRYNVTITDENACVKEQKAIFVRQPDAPLKLNFTQKDVDCFGNSTAEVYPTATGGWGHYEYGFNGLVITSENIISGLDATTTRDTVFVVDSANVVYKLPVVITQPDVLGASINKVHNLKCFEDNTGGVKLGITGGTTPYYVSTDNNNWTEGDSVGGLSATESQKLYVRDANNCETGLETQIAQPELLTIAKDTIIDAFCNQNNGGIHTVINGGTISKNYRHEWYYEDSAQVIANPDNQLLDIYSGRYKLAITDDHECKTESHFLVSDIDGPKINEYAVDSVSCFGGDNGTIYLTGVNGGMPGYAYYINGTESGAEMKGLAKGTHHVRVLDKKGCKADAYIDVKEPDSLQVHEAINAPTCHDSWDASIIAVPSGGNGRYVYIWNNGATGAIIDSLNSGTYGVTITDYKNCSIKQQYEIVPPKMPKPGWDDKLALICTGNYIDVDGGDFKEWLWKNGKGEEVGSDRVAHLTETGNYILQITDGDGCVGLDTFKVDVSDTPLDSKIILPDSAHVNERINVIDVTWPVPDSIEWLYDQPVEVLETNDWSQHFRATNEGEINVTLRAWYGGCYSDSSKTVIIFYEEGFEEDVFKSAGSLITGFRAFPNPNNGEFSIGVSLGREADISISLYAATNTKLIDKQEYKGLDRYEVPYTLGHLKPGMYVIILQAELEQQVMKIVIN